MPVLSFLPQVDDFPGLLEILAVDSNVQGATQFISSLILRIKIMLADNRMNSVVKTENDYTIKEWLETYIGNEFSDNCHISVLDLSLLPSDLIHLIVAVLGRVIFEAIQRYRKVNKDELPTVMVLEEAHNFIQKYNNDSRDEKISPEQLCRQTFERIAREGMNIYSSLCYIATEISFT